MKLKKILIYAILLMIFIPINIYAKEFSRLECNYVSTESFKPKENLTVVFECENMNDPAKDHEKCTTNYKLNGKEVPSQTNIDLLGFFTRYGYEYCPSVVQVKYFIPLSEYNGKYDNIKLTEEELYSKTGFLVEKTDKEVIVDVSFIVDKQNYSVFTNKVSCGSGEGMVTGIPKKIPKLTSLAITIIQIAVPIILILMGSIDLFKGIIAGKEDEMKKGQQLFIKRLVMGAIIFFVVIIVKFLISIVADSNVSNIVSCIDCFIDNACEEE